VHLPIDPAERTVRIEDDRGIVIKSRRSPLKQRRDKDDAETSSAFGEESGRLAGNRLREVEQGGVFSLTEVARSEELLQADDLCAASYGFFNLLDSPVEIVAEVLPASHLNESDTHG